MCGRFYQNLSEAGKAFLLFRRLGLPFPAMPPRYNIAPTQHVHVVLHERDGEPRAERFYWGLVPSWSRDMAMSGTLINARAETLAEKRSFREAFSRRRCLVPADGFYEWKRGVGKAKRPYYFTSAAESEPLAFAGLWDCWNGAGEAIHSFTIVTTEANALVASVHDRMPVILPEERWREWLDPAVNDTERLRPFLRPAAEGVLTCWEVESFVNSAKNEGEQCIRRASSLFAEL